MNATTGNAWQFCQPSGQFACLALVRGEHHTAYSPTTKLYLRGAQAAAGLQVTSISLAFTGEFAALDDRTCISVRTNDKGIPNVPDISLSQPMPAINVTSFAAADAVNKASTLAAAGLANIAENVCSAVDLTVLVDPTAAATGDYYFGAILLDNGQLPFELPKYEGVAEVYAFPSEFPLNCTAGFNPLAPIANKLRLGSAPFEAVAGSTAYAANFTITSEMGMELMWKLPALAGGYHVVVNVTSISDADLYDDTVDACFIYKCGPF